MFKNASFLFCNNSFAITFLFEVYVKDNAILPLRFFQSFGYTWKTPQDPCFSKKPLRYLLHKENCKVIVGKKGRKLSSGQASDFTEEKICLTKLNEVNKKCSGYSHGGTSYIKM